MLLGPNIFLGKGGEKVQCQHLRHRELGREGLQQTPLFNNRGKTILPELEHSNLLTVWHPSLARHDQDLRKHQADFRLAPFGLEALASYSEAHSWGTAGTHNSSIELIGISVTAICSHFLSPAALFLPHHVIHTLEETMSDSSREAGVGFICRQTDIQGKNEQGVMERGQRGTLAAQ